MPITKVDRWSTNASTQTEPTAAEKAAGFVAGEQAVAKEVNWLLDDDKEKINEIIEDGLADGFDDSVGMGPIIKKYIPAGDDAGWAQCYDTPNVISCGATKAYVDLCVYIDSDGDKKILALDGQTVTPTCQIDVIDVATMAVESNSGDLSGSLPAVGTEDWIPEGMCSDGTYVYVMFKDQDANPNETHYVQAYDIATWTKHSGWPATGCQLTGTGTGAENWQHGRVTIASATDIATANPWQTYVNPATECISLIAMDGSDGATPGTEGAGDMTAGRAIGITSDGTYLYVITDDAAGSDVATADMTLAVGAGGNWPYETGFDWAADVIHTGKVVISSWMIEATAQILTTHSQAEELLSTFSSGNARIIEEGGAMAWDGLCVWVRCQIDVDGEFKTGVARVDINHTTYKTSGTGFAAPDIIYSIKTAMVLNQWATIAGGGSKPFHQRAPICFDGRDIWCVGDMRESETLSGKLYRIPKAVLR